MSLLERPAVASVRGDNTKRLLTSLSQSRAVAPMRGLGDFFALAFDILVAMFKWPFAWGEVLSRPVRGAGVARPCADLVDPVHGGAVFTFNVLLVEFGAADFSGVGGPRWPIR